VISLVNKSYFKDTVTNPANNINTAHPSTPAIIFDSRLYEGICKHFFEHDLQTEADRKLDEANKKLY